MRYLDKWLIKAARMRVRVAKAVSDARLGSLEGLRVRRLGRVSNRLARPDVLIFHESG